MGCNRLRLDEAGHPYCWAPDGWTLGDGTDKPASGLMRAAGGLNLATITTGARNTCGLTASAQAYSWGRNAFGEGGGLVREHDTPVPVAGGHTFASSSNVKYLMTCCLVERP